MRRLARTDIAIQTKQLLQEAVWCGVVCGLAAVLLILNLLPPVDIAYRVSGKMLTTATKVQTLRDAMESTSTKPEDPSILAVRILDQSQHDASTSHGPHTVLLSVDSVWNSRCDTNQFQDWLESVSATPASSHISATPQSSEMRLTQWQLDAAKHYLKHQDYVGTDLTPPANVFQLASTGVAGNGSLLQVRSNLNEQVQELEKKLSDLSLASQAQEPSPIGVELTDAPQVKPHSHRIPGWMAMSVLVLGIAVGASAGWLQLRLHSGGVFQPSDVADQLSKVGVPNVARLEIPLDQNDLADWISAASQRASEASRKGGRNLILLGEGLLAFWCLLILARACFDPLWRGLLLDSPLAALGRLLAGMP